MVKKLRRAFTIVELVIVIAVIAVLAAVLIPTFSNIINKSQISADQTNITNLNKQISIELVDGKIESAEDLERVIVKVFGQEYYDNLAPKSAKLGYNYWFNTKTNLVELKKYDESFVSERANLSMTTKSFDENNFRRYGDYYLLDQTGSDFSDAIKGFETLTSSDSYMNAITLVNNILSNENNYHYVQANTLIDKLSKTVIIGNAGTFRYADYINVTNVLFVSGITTINSNLYLYDGTNVISTTPSQTNPVANVSEITLPSTITSVEGNALYFKENKTVNIYGSFKTIDEVKAIFKAYSTNGIIVCEESDGLVLNGSVLEDLNGNSQGNLGYSNPVASFDISCEETDKIKYVSGTLYVAYDQKEFQLMTDNFIGENPNSNISSEEVSWSSSAEGLLIDNQGNVMLSNSETREFTVTATAIAGGHVEEIKIVVVKVEGATITIGENGISAENKVTLTYNGGSSEYDIVTALTYTYSGIVDLADEIIYETSGNIFEVNDNKLKLKEWSKDIDLTKPQILTIIIGEYLTIEVEVTIIDNSAKTFETKFTNDYLYRVGNGNNIKLSSLFISEKPGDNITLTIYDAAKTSGEGNLGQINTTSGFSAQYESSLTKDNWESSTIKFSGTGVAIVEIKNSKGSCLLALEVINGTNITGLQNGSTGKYEISSLGSGNFILLNDVYFNGNNLFVNNGGIYGNGFSLDTSEANPQPSSNAIKANLEINNSILDNIKIIGTVYPEVSLTAGSKYNKSTVETSGKCIITNSYISNCFSALRVAGDTNLENTILDGGTYANLYLSSGKLTLKNVTTINTVRQSYDGTAEVIGFGIVIPEDVSGGKVIIEGTLKQYNWIGKKEHNKYFTSDKLSTAFNLIFSQNGNEMYYEYNGDTYVNTGILSFSSDFSKNNINLIDDYVIIDVGYLFFTGWVMTMDMTNINSQIFFNDRANAPTEFINANSSLYKPTFSFDFGIDNIISKEGDGSEDNRYAVYEDGVINIKRMSNEEAVAIKITDLLTVTKYIGQNFIVNVKCIDNNGNELEVDENGKVIFELAGYYKIIYTITDNLFYDKNGNLASNSIDYTYEVPVNVLVAAPTKNAVLEYIDSTETYISPSGKENKYPTAYDGRYFNFIVKQNYDYISLVPILNINITDFDGNDRAETLNVNSFIDEIDLKTTTSSKSNDTHTITIKYSNNRELIIKITINSYSGNYDNATGYIYTYNKNGNTTYYFGFGQSNTWGNVTMTLDYSFKGNNGAEVKCQKIINWYGDGTGHTNSGFKEGTKTDWKVSNMTVVNK